MGMAEIRKLVRLLSEGFTKWYDKTTNLSADKNWKYKRTMSSDIDIIEIVDDMPSPIIYNKEPIIFRGVGHLTMFGLSSRFDTEFPNVLTGRLAPEELADTMRRINGVLARNMSGNVRWLVCGLLFAVALLTVHALEKLLDHENQTLYNKLGLHWRLVRRPIESIRFTCVAENPF
ncbi:Cysteine-rich hydrophobic domain 2 protein [Dirofilaria immitis]|nr:Cysteine-rich hydrophobic domain 2 protein [Dirofilaria immitis]